MIAPATYGRIKAALRAAVQICGGSEGAAATVEKSAPLARKWHNINDPAMPVLLDAFALDQIAVLQGQRPPILSAYAAELGHVVIRLPDGGEGDDALTGALIDASAEFGDIASEVRDATRDGVINRKERDRIMLQIDEAIAALSRMRAVVAGPAIQVRDAD